MTRYGKVAVLAGCAALMVAPVKSFAGGYPPPPPDPCKVDPKKCPVVKEGRMTGHGHFISAQHGKVQWEFRNSVCNANRFPDLKVEWGTNKFKLTSYSTPLTCLDTPIDEGNPKAGFDTIVGAGAGTLNGRPATATFRFTDSGEPGRGDEATVTIRNASGAVVLQFADQPASAGGNHQAHRK